MSAPESFDASRYRAELPNVKAAGVAALTHAAIASGQPLPLVFKAYAGNMLVSGQVAPPGWMGSITTEGVRQELWAGIVQRLRKKPKTEQDQAFREVWAPHKVVAQDTATAEDPGRTAETELTLVDVTILPAIQTGTGKSGGHVVPVVRIPLASIDVWWILDGEVIKASSSWSGSFGILFPIE